LIVLAYVGDDVNEPQLISSLPKWQVKHRDGTVSIVSDDELNGVVAKAGEDTEYSLADMTKDSRWQVLVPMTKLEPDTLHEYSVYNKNLIDLKVKVTFLTIIGVPDGGLHRVSFLGEF
jgi:hypothetical protein